MADRTRGRGVRRALKTLYVILFLISAVIVAGYIWFRVKVQPPAVDTLSEVVVTLQPAGGEGDGQVVALTRKEGFYTFLLMGCDDGNGNADTIMVGAFDGKSHTIRVVSVPRDTLVDVSRTVKKINAAYGAGGVEQLLDELSGLLGFRPDHFIKVDIRAFVEVVDALGGVTFDVPCDMVHDDGAGFVINLKAGVQKLNGRQALQLVRYRGYANADLGRIETQQKFLRELASQVLSVSSVTRVNEYARILSEYLDTDLTATELAWFGVQALQVDFSSGVSFATLPGDGTVSYQGVDWYYQLYPEECLAILNRTVNPYATDLPMEMTHMFQVTE